MVKRIVTDATSGTGEEWSEKNIPITRNIKCGFCRLLPLGFRKIMILQQNVMKRQASKRRRFAAEKLEITQPVYAEEEKKVLFPTPSKQLNSKDELLTK